MNRYLVCRIIGEQVEMFGVRIGGELTGTDLCAIFADVSEHHVIAERLNAGETVAYVTPIGRRARARIIESESEAVALVAALPDLDLSIERWTRATRASALRVRAGLLRKGKNPSTLRWIGGAEPWAVDAQGKGRDDEHA